MNEKILTFLQVDRLDRSSGDWKSRRQEQSPPVQTDSIRLCGFRFCSRGFNRPIARSNSLKILLLTLLLTGITAPGHSTPTPTPTSHIPAALEMGQPQNHEFQLARRKVRRRPGDDTSPSRGISDPTLPYVISPRNTSILNRQPMLRWNPIPGATSYTVQVSRNGMQWTTEVEEAQVMYAGEPLQPGRYWVTVTADNGISTQDKDDVIFDVLGDGEATNIAPLGGQPLTEEKAFKWVDVYTLYGLYADAIDVLEGQVRSGNRSLDVYGILGDLYLQVGLDALALKHYEEALLRADNTEDVQELQGIIDDLKSR